MFNTEINWARVRRHVWPFMTIAEHERVVGQLNERLDIAETEARTLLSMKRKTQSAHNQELSEARGLLMVERKRNEKLRIRVRQLSSEVAELKAVKLRKRGK